MNKKFVDEIVIPAQKNRKKAPKGYITCEGNKYVKAEYVKTVKGKNYYEKDLVVINDDNGNLSLHYKYDDHIKEDVYTPGNYVDINRSIPVIMGIDERSSKYIYGYTSYSNEHFVLDVSVLFSNYESKEKFIKETVNHPVYDINSYVLRYYNIKVATECGAIECYKTGKVYIGDKEEIERLIASSAISRYESFRSQYRGNNSISSSFIKTGNLRYSFGVEIETANGVIPNYMRPHLDISCERDGSVSGGEYITGVLRGTKGANHLMVICDQLSKRCTTDKRCGVHVHIGDANFNKEFSIYAVVLAEMIEEDIFRMLPKSRRNNRYCEKLGLNDVLPSYKRLFSERNPGSISKSHYKQFIENEFNDLFYKMSHNKIISDQFNRKKTHPLNRYVGGPGTGSFRYKWINLIPCNFLRIRSNGGEQDYTLEFRCLEGRTNFNVIFPWILICMAFVAFVENYKRLILEAVIQGKKITLKEIVSTVYNKAILADKTSLAQKLELYIDNRFSKYSPNNESIALEDLL